VALVELEREPVDDDQARLDRRAGDAREPAVRESTQIDAMVR
jgi:hypothetical protein